MTDEREWELDPISYALGKAAGGGGGGGGGDITVESLSVTENGSYTAPSGKAYSPVSVAVPNSYAAGDEGKVVSNGALVSQTAHAQVTQNGTIDTTLNNSVEVAVSGGGGASNVVTGTFKGTTTAAAMDVDLPYTGNGWPIAALIYPSEGDTGDIAALSQRDAICIFALMKTHQAIQPSYLTAEYALDSNKASVSYALKGSSSGARTYNGAVSASSYYANGAAAGSNATVAVRFKSKTKMSVYIASTSYGFAANITYKYWVFYSE